MYRLFNKLEVQPDNHRLIMTINFAFFINGIMTVMLGVLLPHIKYENTLTYTQAGLIFSFHQIGTLCAVLAAGVLPYMIGRKKSTLLMCAGSVLGLILMVIVGEWYLFAVAFILIGVGRGGLNNTCNVVSADVCGNKSIAMNVLHSCFALGALISPFIVFMFVAVFGSVGWQFAALGVALLMSVIWMLILRSKINNTPTKKEKGKSLAFFGELNFWIPTVLLVLYLAVETSIIGWFVLYFIDIGALPAGIAGFVPTMYWIMMMFGRIYIASISHRIKNKNRFLMLISISTTLCFVGMFLSTAPLFSVVFLFGIGLSMAGIYPTTVATIKTPSESIGFAIAFSGLGSIFMPSIIGAVADGHGLANAIMLLLVALFFMVLLAGVKILYERKQDNAASSTQNPPA